VGDWEDAAVLFREDLLTASTCALEPPSTAIGGGCRLTTLVGEILRNVSWRHANHCRMPGRSDSTEADDVDLVRWAAAGDRGLEFRQSNSEATLIDWIHEAIDRASAIVINPAAFSFTSIAILDALKMFPGPIFEVHISNIHRREEHYHRSYVSKVATGVIAGFGVAGYVISLRAASEALRA